MARRSQNQNTYFGGLDDAASVASSMPPLEDIDMDSDTRRLLERFNSASDSDSTELKTRYDTDRRSGRVPPSISNTSGSGSLTSCRRPDSYEMHVCNLADDVEKDELDEIFAPFNATYVRLRTAVERPNRRYAFVHFRTLPDFTNAFTQVDGKKLNGLQMNLSMSHNTQDALDLRTQKNITEKKLPVTFLNERTGSSIMKRFFEDIQKMQKMGDEEANMKKMDDDDDDIEAKLPPDDDALSTADAQQMIMESIHRNEKEDQIHVDEDEQLQLTQDDALDAEAAEQQLILESIQQEAMKHLDKEQVHLGVDDSHQNVGKSRVTDSHLGVRGEMGLSSDEDEDFGINSDHMGIMRPNPDYHMSSKNPGATGMGLSPEVRHNPMGEVKHSPDRDVRLNQDHNGTLRDSPSNMSVVVLNRVMVDCCIEERMITSGDLQDTVTLFIVHVEDQKYFWGYPLDEEFSSEYRSYQKMMLEINNTKHHQAFNPAQKRCAAHIDREWLRAWVKNINEDGTAQVMSIDYGSEHQVAVSSLQRLQPLFWESRPKAVPFRVEGDCKDLSTLKNSRVTAMVVRNTTPEKEYIITVRHIRKD